jgi:hypothetical protein
MIVKDMKVITTVVINMITGKVLKEESYQYTGPIASCDPPSEIVSDVTDFFESDILESVGIEGRNPLIGETVDLYEGGFAGEFLSFLDSFASPSTGDIPNDPGPNASEEERRQFTAASEEFQLNNQGLRKVSNPDGSIKLEEIPETELASVVGDRRATEIINSRQVNELFTERLTGALQGEIVDPAFESNVAEQRKALVSEVKRGAGLDSTIGQRKLADFDQRVSESRSSIARGEITGFAGEERIRSSDLSSSLLAAIQAGNFQQGQLDLGFAGLRSQENIAALQGQGELFGTIIGAGVDLAGKLL